MPAAPSIRTAGLSDLPAVESALKAAGFSAQVGALMQLPLQSPDGVVFVCEEGGQPAGVAAAYSYPGSRSGWLGAVGVRPAARRRGIGRELTVRTIDWLRERDIDSVGLYATDAGRPLYESLGFEAEDLTVAWRGVVRGVPVDDVMRVRPLAGSDIDLMAALDLAATGESRRALLDGAVPLDGWGVTDDQGALRGYALRTPWGSACPVIADSPQAGSALMRAVVSRPLGGTLIVPTANGPACDTVTRLGLARLNSALRMRLGPPPARRPEMQFATFNLFWG